MFALAGAIKESGTICLTAAAMLRLLYCVCVLINLDIVEKQTYSFFSDIAHLWQLWKLAGPDPHIAFVSHVSEPW